MDERRDEQSKSRIGEDELVKMFQSKDESAFDELVVRYKDRIFNLCYRFLGNYEEADDTAQEVFVRVYRSLPGFRFESSLSTWVYRIAVNACKNKLASSEYRKSKTAVRLDDPVATPDGEARIEIPDESLTPLSILEKQDQGRLIQEAIDALPEDQKIVVVLRDMEGLTYNEIARAAGLNMGTVKSKLARAREELRKRLRRLL